MTTTTPPFVRHASDSKIETFEWGTLQWLCNEMLSAGAEQTVGLCHIDPGVRNPMHFHPNCEEVLYMIAGTGEHSYDGAVVRLSAGSTIRIPRGVRHNMTNVGTEPIVCLITFSSGDRQTVFLE